MSGVESIDFFYYKRVKKPNKTWSFFRKSTDRLDGTNAGTCT